VPQLQTTFVKCLSDPQKEARAGGPPAGFWLLLARPLPAGCCRWLRLLLERRPPHAIHACAFFQGVIAPTTPQAWL
jgi:hypothetical protein